MEPQPDGTVGAFVFKDSEEGIMTYFNLEMDPPEKQFVEKHSVKGEGTGTEA